MTEVHQISLPQVNAVAWAPDSTYLVVSWRLGARISIYRTSDWTLLNTYSRTDGSYSGNSIAFIDHTKIVVSSRYSPPADPSLQGSFHFLEVLDAKSGAHIAYVGSGVDDPSYKAGTSAFSVSADGSMLARVAYGLFASKVPVYNTYNWEVSETIDMGRKHDETAKPAMVMAESSAFSCDKSRIAVGTSNGSLYMYNMLSHEFTRRELFKSGFNVLGVAYSNDCHYLAVGARQLLGRWLNSNDDLRLFAVNGGVLQPLQNKTEISAVWDLAWDKQDHLAVGGANGLTILDMRSGKSSHIVSAGPQIYSVKYSTRGDLAVVVINAGTAINKVVIFSPKHS